METIRRLVSGNRRRLIEGEYSLELVADGASSGNNLIGILDGGGFVLLDGEVTPALAAEGLARDVVRAVQAARKDADLDVSDRIKLNITADEQVQAAISTHAELVKSETLTLELTLQGGSGNVEVGEGQLVAIQVAKL